VTGVPTIASRVAPGGADLVPLRLARQRREHGVGPRVAPDLDEAVAGERAELVLRERPILRLAARRRRQRGERPLARRGVEGEKRIVEGPVRAVPRSGMLVAPGLPARIPRGGRGVPDGVVAEIRLVLPACDGQRERRREDAGAEQYASEAVPPEAGGPERTGGHEDRRGDVVAREERPGGMEVVGVAVVQGDHDAVSRQRSSRTKRPGELPECDGPRQAPEDGEVLREVLRADAEAPRIHGRRGDAVVEEHERPARRAPDQTPRPGPQSRGHARRHGRPPAFTTRAVISIS
jgi:hypothetical protein